MQLSILSWALFGVAGLSLLIVTVEVYALRLIRRRKVSRPTRFPSVSIIKPLCGLDDDLVENLESHLALRYAGAIELLLGVRSEKDAAYPLARDFAAAHPERVRLVIQKGEPGHNPKVNQLISLTREAKNEILVVTDSNVRVPEHYLDELVGLLEQPNVGLASNVFVGVGEQRLGAILDNLLLSSFCAPNLAIADLILPNDQIVGKSLAIPRKVLDQLGGWHEYKDVLAEDQQMGRALREHGYHSILGATPVFNIQRTQGVRAFWKRHSRWAMIRFRVLIPGVLLEPLLNSFLWALIAALASWRSSTAWLLAGAVAVASAALTQTAAYIARGHGFRWHHLLLVPVRDVLFFFIWLRGATLRWVDWRGTKLLVLAKTRLAAPDALMRAKNMQRSRDNSRHADV
jgi:ceramide glucosyltransferase